MTEIPRTTVFEPPEPPPDRVLRRLPWQGPEGRPAHLVAGDGYLSRLADDIECQQFDSARSVWDVAASVLDDPRADRDAVRFAAVRLRESSATSSNWPSTMACTPHRVWRHPRM